MVEFLVLNVQNLVWNLQNMDVEGLWALGRLGPRAYGP